MGFVGRKGPVLRPVGVLAAHLWSLEHELLEVVVQDGVLDVPEHQPDVLRVDGGGEVVVEGLLRGVAPPGPEALHHEGLDVGQAVLRPAVLREVVLERNALHLLLQQVRLVEEEDDGDVDKDAVVDDGLEDVQGLAEPVGLPVLHQHLGGGGTDYTCTHTNHHRCQSAEVGAHLVVLRGRDQEEDGGDRVEALEPAAPLRALPAHVHHLEGDVLDLKVILVDALGGFTGQQNVLLAGHVSLEESRGKKARYCPRRRYATDPGPGPGTRDPEWDVTGRVKSR